MAASPELVEFHDLILLSLRWLGGIGVTLTAYRLGKRAVMSIGSNI